VNSKEIGNGDKVALDRINVEMPPPGSGGGIYVSSFLWFVSLQL
jgi:hypothetical protein